MLLEFLQRFFVWVGFCWLLANWTNALHGNKHPRKLLDKLLILHHLGLLISPLIMLGMVEFSSSQDKTSNSWMSMIPTSPRDLLVTACYLGCLGFALQIIRFQGQKLTAPGKVLSQQTVMFPIEKYKSSQAHKRRWLYMPGNEIWELDFNYKELYLDVRFKGYQGMKILHLSDMHLIGFMNLEYYLDVIERAMAMQPDVIIFSGDLLDHDQFRTWLEPIFKPMAEKVPCYYVLGNHDWSKSNPEATREIMQECGWVDLAGKVVQTTWQEQPVSLCGSELPWMNESPDSSQIMEGALSVLVSHSPDQISWGAKREIGLVLAGHTHGGQIVFPFIGPIYSPSVYGTQYSAGIFKCQKTIMHVSRGIGGENPLRLNCPPEITLLTLRTVA